MNKKAMKNMSKTILAVGIFFLSSAGITQAQTVIINEDYDTPGTGSGGSGWGLGTVTTDAGNIFGAGTSNNYLDIDNNNIGVNQYSPSFTNDTGVLSFSFDFIVAATSIDDEIAMVLNNGTSTSDIVWEMRLRDDQVSMINSTGASTPSLVAGRRYRIDLVTNTTGAEVTYSAGNLGTQTLANNRYDAYLFDSVDGANSVQFAADATFRSDGQIGSSSTIVATNLMLRNHVSRPVDIQIDNVTLETIPEPGSLTLFGLGLGALYLFRRKDRRRD